MTVLGPRRRVLVIPSVTIGRVAAKLETHGRIPRGYLGLGLQRVTVEGGGSGIMVMSVDPKGPGAAANIYQGDVLVSWDGKTAKPKLRKTSAKETEIQAGGVMAPRTLFAGVRHFHQR